MGVFDNLSTFVPHELLGEKVRISRFFDAMLFKLRKNAHKSGFTEITVEEAVKRLEEELTELKEAIEEGNSIEIVLEAADVANFAMLASVAATEGRGGTPE